MLPSAFAVPFTSGLSDRFQRHRLLVVVHLARAVALGAGAALIVGGGPPAAVYATASLAALAATPFRPAHWALLPTLARTPRELVAANVSSSTLESVATVVGPLLGGLLLAVWSPAGAFVLSAVLFLGSAFLTARVGAEGMRPRERGRILHDALAGFRTLAADRDPRLLVVLFVAQTFVRGLLNVLIVVTALELLDLGGSGVGFLNASFGVGGLVGAFWVMTLVTRRRLAYPFAAGMILWGAPIALIGIWPHEWVALLALALAGGGNTLLDVAGLTLIQRIVDDAVLGRVFGVLETGSYAAVGLGAIVAPALVAVFGIRGALVASGLLLPVLALASWRRLGEINDRVVIPERELALLRRLSIFSPLPPATVERLAMNLVPIHRHGGETVVRTGEVGDRFYVVGAGELDVAVDQAPLRRLKAGDAFGEIALLRDVPRTATVTTRTEVDLYGLDRDMFVSAVTGSSASSAAADALIEIQLG
jgi:MFS family permease